MIVKGVMTPGVESVTGDTTVKQAAERMRRLNVGALPVMEFPLDYQNFKSADGGKSASGRFEVGKGKAHKSDGSVLGILTDRDIAVRAAACGKSPNRTRVSEIMSKNVAWVYDDQDVEEAAKLMQEKKIRRLLVKNREGQVIGIVSLGDISTTSSLELAGETVREISEPSQPER